MPYDIYGRPIDKKLDDDHLFGNDGWLTAIVILMCVGLVILMCVGLVIFVIAMILGSI